MDTYKRFTSEDVIVGDTAIVSAPMWSNGVSELTSFPFTPAALPIDEYYINVYNIDPVANPDTAEVQFSAAYGHYAGSGSFQDPDILGGTKDRPSKVVYRQFASLLLDDPTDLFNINNADQIDCYFISVARARFKQRIDPGNWTLEVNIELRDGSGAGEDPTVNSAGRVYNVYEYDSGTGEILTTGDVYGLFYPDMGIIVLRTDAAAAVTTPDRSANPVVAVYNADVIIGDMFAFQARTEEKVTSNYYFVRATNKQFNYSSNTSFVSGSNGAFRWSIMQTNPNVYITTVGLYDDANQLLAVAKLSKPVLKNFNREALIKVKIDY